MICINLMMEPSPLFQEGLSETLDCPLQSRLNELFTLVILKVWVNCSNNCIYSSVILYQFVHFGSI